MADIIRTTLGPRSMLKMLLDASGGTIRACFAFNAIPWTMLVVFSTFRLYTEPTSSLGITGNICASPLYQASQSLKLEILCCLAGIVLTNDGNAILRELDVAHPAAKVCLCILR